MNPKQITSHANAEFKTLASLSTTKGILKTGLAIISGTRFINEIIHDHSEVIVGWISPENEPPPLTVDRWYVLGKLLFNELDLFGTGTPLLLIKVPNIEEYLPESAWPIGASLFVPFQNPDNCGAVIRTAAALGASRIILLQEAAHPFHPKALRAAGPAIFKIPLLRGPSINDVTFSDQIYFSLSAEGTPLHTQKFPKTFALLPGVEGPGVPAHLRKTALSIPMQPGIESLNAATATALALYEWNRQVLLAT